MPVDDKILGISRICYRRVDENWAEQCFFRPYLPVLRRIITSGWQIVTVVDDQR